jgi:two-component system cell cycle sensor histidine kinase PleC
MMIGADRKVPVCNSRAAELIGVAPARLAGRPTLDELLAEQRRAEAGAEPRTTLLQHLASEAPSGAPRAFEHRRPDGAVIEVRTVPLPEGGGTVCTFADVTALRERQEVLRRTEAATARALAAEEASRIKSQFVANMSHELRTPLNAVIGFSEIIESEMLGPLGHPRYRAYAHDVVESGRHLLAVVNDILDLAKIEAGHLDLHADLVEPREAARDCLRLVEQRAEESGIALRFTSPGTALPPVTADPLRLRQVLLNLLSNAVKFTPRGGSVTVAVEADATSNVVFAVSDTGPGMHPDEVKIALMPFRQIDGSLARRHEGTGLGLPLADRLVQIMHGKLEIESTPPHGTTVRVRLPAVRTPSRVAAA